MKDTSIDFVRYVINNNRHLINDFALIDAQREFKKSIDERENEAKAVRQNEQTQEVFVCPLCRLDFKDDETLYRAHLTHGHLEKN